MKRRINFTLSFPSLRLRVSISSVTSWVDICPAEWFLIFSSAMHIRLQRMASALGHIYAPCLRPQVLRVLQTRCARHSQGHPYWRFRFGMKARRYGGEQARTPHPGKPVHRRSVGSLKGSQPSEAFYRLIAFRRQALLYASFNFQNRYCR